MTNGLCFTLLGRFSATSNGAAITAATFYNQKVQELLCYLLLHRHTPHHREHLAAVLWENATSAQSKQYLRKALWQLQSALEATSPNAPLIIADNEWIQLDPRHPYTLDLAQIEEVYQAISLDPAGLMAAADNPPTNTLYTQMHAAAALYRGDLLDGWYHEWCFNEREHLRHMYLVILDRLVEHCLAHHDYLRGVDYAEQSLRCDTAREYTHRQIMLLYARAGDRSRALRQYERCVATLERELNVGPAESTTALYRQICQDQIAATLPPMPLHGAQLPVTNPATEPAADLTLLNETTLFLDRVSQTLDDLQAQVNAQRLLLDRGLQKG